MQFKELGGLFDSLGEMSNVRFRGATSIEDMQGFQKDSFNAAFKISSDGISEYTTEQIRAKSATLELSDSLTTQAIALGKDADFTAKASTGKYTFRKAIADNINDVDKIGDALLKTGKLTESQISGINNLTKGSKEYTDYLTLLINGSDNLADSFIDLGTAATTSSSSLSTIFTGLWATLKPMLPLIAAITAGFAAFKLVESYVKAYDNALNKASDSLSEYKNTSSELESLNSELETTQSRIQELQSQGTLTITEESELTKLQEQNNELQRQIDLKEQISETQSEQSAKDAIEALTLKRTSDLTSGVTTTGTHDQPMTVYDQTDVVTATRNELNELTKLKKKRSKLLKEYNKEGTSHKRKSVIDDELKGLDQQIKNYDSKVQKQIESLNTLRENFKDQITGEVNPEYKSWFNDITSLVDDFNSIDLSPAEKKLNNIEKYFNGSTGRNVIKDQLVEAVKAGKNADDALRQMGISLNDAGLDAQTLNSYFKELAKEATDAANAVNKINNNLTIEDVGGAFETKNEGDDFISLNDYLKKAKDLYDQGLTGTDDFKSVAEAISYNIDSSTESFINNYQKLQRYFTEDDDGNLTGAGINNFLTDLQNLDKGYAAWDENNQKWNINMDNTAQAAKELGISVQSMEAIFGRIKDYDNLGDFNFTSALQDFDDAKTSIEGIDGLLESISDADYKDELSNRLENWKSQLDMWEGDLATLDTDIVMNIRLEYSLAEIQAQIDEIKKQGEYGGDLTRDDHAQLIGLNEQKYDTLKTGTGLEQEGVTIPAQVEFAESAVEKAMKELEIAVRSGDNDAVLEAQVNLEATQDSRNELIEQFKDWNLKQDVQINADSNIEDVNAQWKKFLSDDNNHTIVAKFQADTSEVDIAIDKVKQGEALQKFVELVGVDNASYLVTIWNTLQADPKFSKLSAEDQATQVVQYWNDLSPEQKNSVMVATMTAEDKATATLTTVDGTINTLNLDPNVNITASDSASGPISSVGSSLATLNGTTAHTYIVTHKSTVGDSKLLGTAHKNGTAGLYPIPKLSGHALAMGSLSDSSWLRPNWKTQKDETALAGEIGQELVVSNNRWWTVGDDGAEFTHIPQGSVVFNAKQTKELFKNGFTNSRGIARLSGTAYAGGASGGFNFSGGASIYNPPNSGSSYNPSYDPAPIQETAQATQDTADAAEEFNEELDHIQNKIDRLERKIKSIERIAGSAFENFATRNDALKDQISSVIEEIKVQQQAYDRYIQQANSIGLSDEYKNKIKNGAIDIETITDKDLNENISSFKEW